MVTTKQIGLALGPTLFFLILYFFQPLGLSEQAIAVLAATAWIAVWWITEAIPIAATALLPLVLFPLTAPWTYRSLRRLLVINSCFSTWAAS